MQIARDDGRLLAGRGRHPPQGHGQEDPRELIAHEREKFVEGRGRARLREQRAAEDMFDMIEPFADYGFNESHACAYGYVAYQTAYLKAHHPVEYLAAILTSVKDDKDRKPYYLYECRGMGIEVLPPDVNESDMDFAPAPGGRPGDPLRAVGGAQRRRGRRRADPRRPRGRRGRSSPSPTSAGGSTRRCSPSACSSRSILAGAFDSLGYTRGGHVAAGRRAARLRASCRRRSSRSAKPRRPGSSRCSAAMEGGAEIDESVLPARSSTSRAPAVREGDARAVRDRPPAARRRGRS